VIADPELFIQVSDQTYQIILVPEPTFQIIPDPDQTLDHCQVKNVSSVQNRAFSRKKAL
jgi:hypothetical protein